MLVTSWEEIITSWFLFQNIFILRRPKVTNFADIIKIKIIFIKKTFEGSKIVKRMRNRHLKCNLHLYYLIYQSGPNEPILCTTNARFCGKQQSCHLNGCHTTGINSLFNYFLGVLRFSNLVCQAKSLTYFFIYIQDLQVLNFLTNGLL